MIEKMTNMVFINIYTATHFEAIYLVRYKTFFLYEIEEYLLSNESRDVDFFFEILKSRRPPGDFQWLYFSLKTLQFCVFCKNKKFQTKIYVREASRKPTEFNI